MGRVQGKVILVTGTASDPGLGRSTAMRLAAEGASIAVTDINEAGAQATAAAINDAGGRAIALRQDVTDEAGWQRTIEATETQLGALDVLVNNAGIAVLMPMAEMTLADFQRQIDVNLTSVFLGCKYGMAAMRVHGKGGSIVNLSSVAGLVGLPRCTAYGAAKGGVRIMSKAVAMEGAPDNIRCNSVHPGVIWTNMQAQAGGAEAAGNEAPPAPPNVPLGRMGEPLDIANCVLYLASDEASYVTGAEFTIDAGMTAI
jgi:NAD(P)-dependent dehydrogenase (short-subunit alcohol dehydrogenase family)